MKLVQGYQPLMPTFQGLIDEEQLAGLIEYIKQLPPPAAAHNHGAPVPGDGEQK
jgi:hypothetical protein